jgi:cytochrome c5
MNFFRSILLISMVSVACIFASSATKASEAAASHVSASSSEQEQRWIIEGEKRYRANCARCHQSPHKFPPRTMAMVIRHMRVRAMLTDDDMKYVLYYMTH